MTCKNCAGLKGEIEQLAKDKIEEMKTLIKELKDDTYDESELQDILDNWGGHDVQ